MGVIKIENRGKNLWSNPVVGFYTNGIPVLTKTQAPERLIYQNNEYIFYYSHAYRGVITQVPLMPNKTYYLKFESNTADKIYIAFAKYPIGADMTNIYNAFASGFTDTYTSSFKIEASSMPGVLLVLIGVKYSFRTDGGYIHFKNPILFASDDPNLTANDITYEPPNYIEFNQELFGYNGVFDTLTDDGTLIKRWQKETGRTVTSGSASVTKSGTGTCILVNETYGTVYEGTVSGTNISTSAPDGTYTVIYQLATPEISTLYLPEKLKVYPGDNNILITDTNGSYGLGVLTTDANIEYHL